MSICCCREKDMDGIGSIVSVFKATKDKKIFEVLYDIHYDKAFKKAYFILRDPLLCQDVVQEAFIKAFTNIGKLRDNNKFSPWLLAIVEKEALISIKNNFK
jgi:DNA-directed RNA polymerase specialized sigma24 family protein